MDKKKLNLLFFLDCGEGNPNFLVDQLLALEHSKRFNIFAIKSGKDQTTYFSLKWDSLDVPKYELKGLEEHKHFLQHLNELRQYIKNNKIDIIHVQSNWQLVIIGLCVLGLNFHPKIIYTIHAFRNNEGTVKKIVAKWLIILLLYIFSDCVIASCQYLMYEFAVLGKKLKLLNLGINNSFIEHQFVEVKDKLSLIFPAAFRKGKRQEMIIAALADYQKTTQDKDWKLVLAGSGDLLQNCKNKVCELGLEENVIFTGNITTKELLKYYDQTNIMVCSSISETYCFAIAEAFCLGKCIITTPVGIATELIKNGKNGFFFNNAKELTKVLIKLHNTMNKAHQICEKNYNNRNKFNWNYITNEYIKMVDLLA